MKQFIKKVSLWLLAASLVPATLMAQKEKEEKAKEKKEAEQIIITRKGNPDEKIVVELMGDKVIVNGKEVKDKDGEITVHRNKIKDVWAFGGEGVPGLWSEHGGNHLKMYSTGENRAMLGVSTDQADEGVEIQSVTEESAAEKAGLKKGDIIKAIDDKKIETPDDLSETIGDHKPGDKVSVKFLRDKKDQKVTVELGKWKGVTAFSIGENGNFNMNFDQMMPKAYTVPRVTTPRSSFSWSGGGPRLGLSVQETEDGKGVNVIEVDEDGNAAKAGIKEKDIITEVDGNAVNSTEEIATLMRVGRTKSSVKVKLLRNGKVENIEV